MVFSKEIGEELLAAPGTRMFVTVDFSDVTDNVIGGISDDVQGRERDLIEANRKALIAECESEAGFRCSVPSFFQGLEYKFANGNSWRAHCLRACWSIGNGGDVDNWMWLATGDFSFYRAYVGKDGKPADYSEENVPFKPTIS